MHFCGNICFGRGHFNMNMKNMKKIFKKNVRATWHLTDILLEGLPLHFLDLFIKIIKQNNN